MSIILKGAIWMNNGDSCMYRKKVQKEVINEEIFVKIK